MKWILCIDPTHSACHLPFQNNCLLKFQFTTYLWSTPLKNPVCAMCCEINKLFTWFKICEITCEIDITNFIKVKNHFNCFWNIFSFFSTQLHGWFSYQYISIRHENYSKKLIYSLFYFLGCLLPLWKQIVLMTQFNLKSIHIVKHYNVIT